MLLALILLFAAIAIAGVVAWLRRMVPATRERYATKFRALWRWLRANGQEVVGIPMALLIYWASGVVIRWFEPSSAIYDSGVLQGATVAIVHLLVGNSVAHLGVKYNVMRLFSETNSTNDRKWLFALYLLAYCALASFI